MSSFFLSSLESLSHFLESRLSLLLSLGPVKCRKWRTPAIFLAAKCIQGVHKRADTDVKG